MGYLTGQINSVISHLNCVEIGNTTMAKKAKQIDVDPKMCKGCHICIFVCPHDVLKKADVVDNRGFFLPVVTDLEACVVCCLCEMECPDFAISVVEE